MNYIEVNLHTGERRLHDESSLRKRLEALRVTNTTVEEFVQNKLPEIVTGHTRFRFPRHWDFFSHIKSALPNGAPGF